MIRCSTFVQDAYFTGVFSLLKRGDFVERIRRIFLERDPTVVSHILLLASPHIAALALSGPCTLKPLMGILRSNYST